MTASTTLVDADPPRPDAFDPHACDPAVRRLVGWLAHRLNSQFTAVLGRIQLLEWQSPEEEETSKDLEELRMAVEESCTVVERLLAMTSQQVVRPRRLELRAVLRNWSTRAEESAGSSPPLDVTLPPERVEVEMDPAQLDEMLDLLLDRCRADEPARIGVSVTTIGRARTDDGPPEPGWVVLDLRHDGPALSEAQAHRLLHPLEGPDFFAADLAMAAVAGMARQNGARLDIPTGQDGEACFRLHLPLAV